MADCLQGVKLEERIKSIEKVSDIKDEENERSSQNIKSLFEMNQKETDSKMKQLEDKIDCIDSKIDSLEHSIPGTVEKAVTDIFNKLSGKLVKWLVVVGVGAVVIALMKSYGVDFIETTVSPWLKGIF